MVQDSYYGRQTGVIHALSNGKLWMTLSVLNHSQLPQFVNFWIILPGLGEAKVFNFNTQVDHRKYHPTTFAVFDMSLSKCYV